ncbi:hypothetical protein [Pseudobacter ginsenosidimutans]|uniref:Uncharacterized protein n=1 Tax=Pseudobacter ginsenosidimutans TaxID=661488 RepID=A0A4Q7MCF8_9BACT|nr:hypothetical protein [Pseudobacter ginsenosidimutans]QEC45270.1 hypothetical protein FSB84_27585 [Pseudobacter ginsenosidimutans]RZS65541.1 hypothetical protein EV199_5715 [Pseudobacter ginsenosidimutans]
MSTFLTYSRFYTKEEAEEFAALLDANNILFDAERLRTPLDNIYLGEDSEPKYIVKVMQEDFGKVESLVKKEMEKQVDELPADYYLFQFSNEELLEVLQKSEDWNHLDQTLAKRLLQQRNVRTDGLAVLAVFNEEEINGKERISTTTLVITYLLAIIFAIVGMLIGALMITAKRTMKDGSKMPLYDNWTVNQGWIVFNIGLVRTLIFLYFAFR